MDFSTQLLPKRGPKAFDGFLDALRESDQDHIADQLMAWMEENQAKECKTKSYQPRTSLPYPVQRSEGEHVNTDRRDGPRCTQTDCNQEIIDEIRKHCCNVDHKL